MSCCDPVASPVAAFSAAGRVVTLALVGNPNCGKTALFNRLTGARQKVANYAGVTVERKEGLFHSAGGRDFKVIDLPGAYSLNPLTPDEAITRDVLMGEREDEAAPDIVVLVVDATNLRRNLRIVLEVARLKRPAVLALNMMDVAARRGLQIDIKRLEQEIGMPVVETVAIRARGSDALVERLEAMANSVEASEYNGSGTDDCAVTQEEIVRILGAVVIQDARENTFGDRLDRIVLHPVLGYIVLAAILFTIFQAVFSWSKLPTDVLKDGVTAFGALTGAWLPEGVLRSLIVDGIIAGVGSVVVFLPQILILFFFILVLEESGYLPRAAFMLDRMMGSVGLSGRAFIPLLSSFACAVPGIMATRTIQNPRDRLATIMIAPLMTCSARLPVYALVIGAFIPETDVGIFNLQGLVLFALYLAGIFSAMSVAWVIKRVHGKSRYLPLMLELPDYHWPNVYSLALGLWERARIFLTRVGTIILSLMIVMWFLSTFPGAPEGATEPAIMYSFAGRLGQMLQAVVEPVGFNWQIAIALVPGLAAREVAVGALGTVYALSATGDDVSVALTPMIAETWSLATAFSLLAWYVFAPQCISTLAMVRRETNSWKPAITMAAYMFALAYAASFVTYRVALMLGGGA